MMKHAKGASLAEIMEATGWQAHTVRGSVRLIGSKGAEKIEFRQERGGRSNVPRCQVAELARSLQNAACCFQPGAAFFLHAWSTLLSKWRDGTLASLSSAQAMPLLESLPFTPLVDPREKVRDLAQDRFANWKSAAGCRSQVQKFNLDVGREVV
jgi:hypothetical protein